MPPGRTRRRSNANNDNGGQAAPLTASVANLYTSTGLLSPVNADGTSTFHRTDGHPRDGPPTPDVANGGRLNLATSRWMPQGSQPRPLSCGYLWA